MKWYLNIQETKVWYNNLKFRTDCYSNNYNKTSIWNSNALKCNRMAFAYLPCHRLLFEDLKCHRRKQKVVKWCRMDPDECPIIDHQITIVCSIVFNSQIAFRYKDSSVLLDELVVTALSRGAKWGITIAATYMTW